MSEIPPPGPKPPPGPPPPGAPSPERGPVIDAEFEEEWDRGAMPHMHGRRRRPQPPVVVTIGNCKVTLGGPALILESTVPGEAIVLQQGEAAILHLLLHRYDRINPDGEAFMDGPLGAAYRGGFAGP